MNFTKLLLALFLPATLTAAETPAEIPLWPTGAPGFEERRHEPVLAKDYWIKNIHNPSVTVYLPPQEKATGAAVVICPGGGHRELVFRAEGAEPARYLNSIGVAAFVLKYRLARETNSPYSLEKHPREDGLRAMRLVRSRAAEWNVDPKRVGIMGFSAGGEVVSMVAYAEGAGDSKSADLIEQQNRRPDFQILIYPGPLGIPEKIPAGAPPAFLLVANDDRGASRSVVLLLSRLREVGVLVETHIFAHGGHACNMGHRSQLTSIKNWSQRLKDGWPTGNF